MAEHRSPKPRVAGSNPAAPATDTLFPLPTLTDLSGRSALVTGAARGIGFAASKALSDCGARVMLADVDVAAVKQAAEDLGDSTGRWVKADVSSLVEIDAMVEECVAELGGIDILVNNAAVTRLVDVMSITAEDWDAMHSVNARGAFFTMQRAARAMIESGGGGRIINIASIAGKGFSGSSNAAYAASKGAVIAMTFIAARQLAPHGIRVNAVCPGLTRTPLGDNLVGQAARHRGVPEEQFRSQREATIPIGRECEPGEVAAMVAFLAGPGAEAITGQSINVDGGLLNF